MVLNLLHSLREIAKRDAKKGEYHPEEHVAWLAAIRIEELEKMLDGKGDARLLHEIASRIWLKEQDERLMEKARSHVQSDGTG